MSEETRYNIDEEMKTSYLQMSTHLRCNIHQVLNKYYLKKKETFVCEYDGFDEDGPDSFMHMPEILEKYHDEIINLQKHPEYFEKNEFELKIPNYAKSGKNLNVEINKFNYDYQKFMDETFSRIIHFIKANHSLNEIKDLINEVKFTPQKKPQLSQIGMDDHKEENLLILAQFLVLHNHDSISKADLTEKLIKFLEDYQYKMVDMIFNSLDFLELSYQMFLPEIAKLEKKHLDVIKNKDYLRSHITSQTLNDEMIQKYLDIIKEKDNEIMQLNLKLASEKKKINPLEDNNLELQKKLNELQRQSKEREDKLRLRIEELENMAFLNKEEMDKNYNNKLKNHADEIKKIQDFHDNEINKIRTDYQKQNESQKKDFDTMLNSYKNHYNEIEKNQKDLSNSVYNANNQNQGDKSKEFEKMLNDEKKKNQENQTNSEQKLKEINTLYFNLSKEHENDKKQNIENEGRLKDLNNKLLNLEKENENLRKNLKEKEDLMLKSLDDHQNERTADKKNIDNLVLSLMEKEKENEKHKQNISSNENYKKYFDMYLSAKKEHEKALHEKDGLINNNKYLQKEIELAKANRGDALNSLNTQKEEFQYNYDKINNLNNSLQKQVTDKNRKLELIQKKTEILNERLKLFPWGMENLLSKTESTENKRKVSVENESVLRELDTKCSTLKKKNEEKERKILDLVNENLRKENRIINLLSQNGQIEKVELTKEMKLSNNEKTKILMEKMNKKEITEKDFANLNFIQKDLNSLLLLNRSNIYNVRNWMFPAMKNFLEIKDLKGNMNFNLIHKASIHGYGADAFLKKCGNMNNLLVICLTEKDKLIGGFSPLKWIVPKDDEKVYLRDEELKSFLFSVTLNRKLPLYNSDFAIMCSNHMGPVFGGGSDLEIVNNSNVTFNNYGNIGNSYADSKPINANDFYGNEKYLIQDYEVYQVML